MSINWLKNSSKSILSKASLVYLKYTLNLILLNTRMRFKLYFSSVTQSCPTLATPWTTAHLPSCPSPTPGVYSDSCPLSWWYHLTISSSVIPFSSRLQSFPASGSFPMCQLFASGGQNIGVSASTLVLPMNISGLISIRMDWSYLLAVQGTLKSLLHTTVQKHQFFGTQLSF